MSNENPYEGNPDNLAVPDPPHAFASSTLAAGSEPLTVAFSGTTESLDLAGEYTYEWDFGDGTKGEGQVVEHTYMYSGNGIFICTLTVTDKYGQSSQASLPVLVQDVPGPTPIISSTMAVGKSPLGVAFEGTGSHGTPPFAYRWTFSDSMVVVEGPIATHTFVNNTGTNKVFYATLIVRDGLGQEAQKATPVLVLPA